MLKAKFGNHYSLIFKSEEELFSLVVPFLIEGLKQNQKGLYFYHRIPKQRIIDQLENKFDVGKFFDSGQLELFSCKDTYLKDGTFEPDKMIDLLKKMEKKALNEGYSGLRITGEAAWALEDPKNLKKLNEYEKKLDAFFPGSKTLAVCQYDETLFTPEVLAETIHCHPDLIFYDKVCENYFYSPELRGANVSFPPGSYELIKQEFNLK